MKSLDKFSSFKEIFKGVIRNLISYLAHHYPKVLDILRERLKESRYNPTVDRVKYKQNTVMIVHLSTPIHSEIYGTGEYEKNEINFLQKTLKREDIFIDIGANIGLYTIVAGKLVGEGGTVVAFEPSRREYELLMKNIRLNKLSNVKPIKAAVSDYTGHSKLLIAGGMHTGMNTLASNFFYGSDVKLRNVEEIPTHKLDDFYSWHNVGRITGIKIDVEGYDLFALKGMRNTLERFKPFLMLEINEKSLQIVGCSGKQIFSFLQECDYEIFYYDEKGTLTKNPPQYVSKLNPSYDIVCFPK